MIMKFEAFILNEAKKKWSDSNHPYFKGLSKSTVSAKKRQMKKQASMDDSDPNAYEELPGDESPKIKRRTSKHTEMYNKMYGK
jgi:hypothetical protein